MIRSNYAVKTAHINDIPVITIKKFYYDNEKEEKQLEQFSKSGADYKEYPALIINFCDNGGGSDDYIYQFLTGFLPDIETDEPLKDAMELMKEGTK